MGPKRFRRGVKGEVRVEVWVPTCRRREVQSPTTTTTSSPASASPRDEVPDLRVRRLPGMSSGPGRCIRDVAADEDASSTSAKDTEAKTPVDGTRACSGHRRKSTYRTIWKRLGRGFDSRRLHSSTHRSSSIGRASHAFELRGCRFESCLRCPHQVSAQESACGWVVVVRSSSSPPRLPGETLGASSPWRRDERQRV